MLKRATLLAALVLVTVAGQVRADDCEGISCSCSPGQGTQTCSDGSEIDVCDTCPDSSAGGSSGGGGGGNAAKGVVMLVAMVISPFAFVLAPGVTLELMYDNKGQHGKFGDKKAAREAWEKYRDEQKRLVEAGKQIKKTNAILEKGEVLRDAITANIPSLLRSGAPAAVAVAARPWWTAKARLVPTLEFRCRTSKLTFPFHLFRDDPIDSFANVNDMLQQCAGFYPVGVDAPACGANTARCRALRPDGSPFCCPLNARVFNSVDNHCYPDSDFRAARMPDPVQEDAAQRHLQGETCGL